VTNVMDLAERGPEAWAVRIGQELRLAATEADAKALAPPGTEANVRKVVPYKLVLQIQMLLDPAARSDPDRERRTLAGSVIQNLLTTVKNIDAFEQANAPMVVPASNVPRPGGPGNPGNPGRLRLVKR